MDRKRPIQRLVTKRMRRKVGMLGILVVTVGFGCCSEAFWGTES